MSWWRADDQYGVLFNRDEKKTRPRAEPPEIREGDFISPRDPTGGGTWLSVNNRGVIVGLLNRWHERQTGEASRGQLVWSLAGSKSVDEIGEALETMPLGQYPAFTLIAIDRQGEARWDWNTINIARTPASVPAVSSSFEPEGVISYRQKLYHEMVGSPADSEGRSSFHQLMGEGAFSPRMLRGDAQTWSRSHISVNREEIHWSYLEEFLDFGSPPEEWKSNLGLL